MEKPLQRKATAGLGFLMMRALFPKGGSLLTLALWISVAGVALGVAMLILVLSVMSGFLDFLQSKYTDITSSIVVLPKAELVYDPSFRKELEKVPGVREVAPFSLGQAMLIKNGVGGVTLEGIQLSESKKITPWEKIWVVPPSQVSEEQTNWIWIGKGLADKLRIKKGETVELMFGVDQMRTETFVVDAITKFGIFDHDLRYSYVSLPKLKSLFGRNNLEPFYKVALNESEAIEKMVFRIKSALKEKASVKKWSDINQNIFLAVRHQKMLLFWVLDIVVALAAMNVINLLMMSTYQRKRDVAILRAMGMRFKSIVLFFVGQGTIVGFLGVCGGIVSGVGLCALVERYQPSILNEAVYNVSKLPLKIQMGDVALVATVALFLCVVFSLVPALKAALSRPVQALRYE